MFDVEILQHGQKKFRGSSLFWLTAVLFLPSFSCILLTVGVESTTEEKPLVSPLLEEVERKSKKKTEGSSQLPTGGKRVVLEMKKGRKEDETARAYLLQAYLLFTRDHPHLEKGRVLVEEAMEHKRNARKISESQLSSNPHSTQLIQTHSALLRDVFGQDDLGGMYLREGKI